MSIKSRVERMEAARQGRRIHVVRVYEGETTADAAAIELSPAERGPNDLVVGITQFDEYRPRDLPARHDADASAQLDQSRL